MKRDFILNILFLLIANLLIKPFFIFGIDRSIQNEVGPDAYGTYFALFNFTLLFQIIIDFGIQNYNNRNIAQHHHLLPKYFSHILLLKAELSLVYGVVIGIVGYWVGYGSLFFPMLALMVVNQVLLSFILYLRSNISGLQLFFTDSILSVLDRVLLIIICGVLLRVNPLQHKFEIEWFVYAQTAAYALTAITAFILVLRRVGKVRLRWHKPFQWLLLRDSFPFALTVFLMSVYTRIDGVMIERLLPNGAQEAGIYASAYRLLDAANIIGYLFAGLLLPMFARQLKNGTNVAELARFGFQAIWVVSVTAAAGAFCFRYEIMTLLYHGANAYSGDLLGWLMLSFPAVSTMYIYGSLLTANGNMRAMNILFACSVIVNILLNMLWIPQYFALGAAYATLCTQIIVAVTQIGIAKNLFDWRVSLVLPIKSLFFLVLTFIIFYTIKSTFPNGNWVFLLVGGALFTTFIAFLLRLIDIIALWNLVKNKK